jgi:type II secretion system protein H
MTKEIRIPKGFTLIELMVVVAIIGIMTALIVPQMQGTYQDAVLRASGRKLVDAFTLASSHAITLSQPHRVRIDLKTGRYAVEGKVLASQNGAGPVPIKDIPGGAGEIDKRVTVQIQNSKEDSAEASDQGPAFVTGEDLRIRKREEAISFYPDGTADAAEILLRDREGFRLALRINPVTARVHLVEMERAVQK